MSRPWSFVFVALLLSCGGTQPEAAVAPSGPSETVSHASAEPTRDARARFENPGGMWMPRQLAAHTDTLRRLGVEIPMENLGDPTRSPLGAVVSLGGCTASFVSPDGLLVTNHHCVQGALQFNSTPETNLVENGFLARTRSEEISAGPAQRVFVTQRITDVTANMREGLEAMSDGRARFDALEERSKRLIKECEANRPGIRCQVHAFFKTLEYQLIESLEIRDVRLVYVPARSIGNYGGEIDNWAWPRHTGDFSFYRAYVGPDGKPADFSESNVPFSPPHHLRMASEPLEAGDFVMVAGFPGRTNRQQTASELRHAHEFTWRRFVEKAEARMHILQDLQSAQGETAIKAGVMRQSVQNGLEKYQGIQAGLADGRLLVEKEAEERAFREWAAADPTRARYVTALDALEQKLASIRTNEIEDEVFRDVTGASSLLRQAIFIARWVDEHQKPDEERKPGYQDRDEARVRAGQRTFTKQFDATIDRAMLRLFLVRALGAVDANRSWLGPLLGARAQETIDEARIDRALAGLYGPAGSVPAFAEESERLELLSARASTVARSRDPWLKLARLLLPHVKELEARDEAGTGDLALLYPVVIEGLLEFRGGLVAPDANGTLRITYGTVRGYRPSPDRPVYAPFTTADEILAKNTGNNPFDAPSALLEAIERGRFGPYGGAKLPVNFLSDVDITGGNSGSPVLNRRGEIVGLAFDGNFEGLASDVLFKGATTRTISCDFRYVLFVADSVDHADNLLSELGISPAFQR